MTKQIREAYTTAIDMAEKLLTQLSTWKNERECLNVTTAERNYVKRTVLLLSAIVQSEKRSVVDCVIKSSIRKYACGDTCNNPGFHQNWRCLFESLGDNCASCGDSSIAVALRAWGKDGGRHCPTVWQYMHHHGVPLHDAIHGEQAHACHPQGGGCPRKVKVVHKRIITYHEGLAWIASIPFSS